jgi:hypothetical protein
MSRRTFRIATLVIGGLVVLGVSVDAATGVTSPSVLERLGCVACSACAWVGSLIH